MPRAQPPAFRFSLLKPNRLDLYVLSEVLGPFLGGIIFFLFLFLMFQALRLAEFFIIHGIDGLTLAKLTSLMALSFLPTALSIAFLIAVLVAFGRLSSDSELVAMKASGIGIGRLSVPVAGLALVVVAVSMGLNIEWCPWGERTFKKMLIRVSNTKVISAIHEGTFTSGFFDLLIFADKVETKGNRMSRVFIYDEREPKSPMTIVARSGEIISVKSSSRLGSAAVLKLNEGSIHRNEKKVEQEKEKNTYHKIDFGEYRLFLKIDEGADTATIKPQMRSYRDLTERIRGTDLTTYEGREWRGEYWRRISVAMTPFFFVFLGIGFGTVRTRAVRAGAALIALGTLFVYWTALTLSTIAVQKGWILPVVAMQLPNFLILSVAIYVFRRASW